jgi:hypothetical protein
LLLERWHLTERLQDQKIEINDAVSDQFASSVMLALFLIPPVLIIKKIVITQLQDSEFLK